MEVQVLHDAGEVLLDAPSTVLVIPEVGVSHLGLQHHPALVELGDPQVAERLRQSGPERGEIWGEVLHVSPRGSA